MPSRLAHQAITRNNQQRPRQGGSNNNSWFHQANHMEGGPGFAPHLNRLQGAAREFLLQIRVALIAGHELAQHFANAAMTARKLNHSIRERRAPKISIEATPHLRSSS